MESRVSLVMMLLVYINGRKLLARIDDSRAWGVGQADLTLPRA